MVNRQWVYSTPVSGNLKLNNFSLREMPLPVLKQGQALVRNKLISLDPANRFYLVAPSYRPQVHIGDVMAGFGIGEVVASTDWRFTPGDIIHADLGWQDYRVINSYERSEFVYKCIPGHKEDELLGIYGISGLTAWFAVQQAGKLQPGQTIVVSGASGACGVIIGQLAKIAGCHVVGFGGGIEKCQWLVDEIGFDAAVDYKDSDVATGIANQCPAGIDYFFDAVGGHVANATIPLMNKGASWCHYGNISAFDSLVSETQLQSQSAISPQLERVCERRNIKSSSFLVFDFYDQRKRATSELMGLVKNGKLKTPITTLLGLENLPSALVEGTLGGAHYGKLNVRIA